MSTRLKRWLITIILVITVITCAAIVLKRWMNTSSSGSVQIGSSSQTVTNTEPVAIETHYFSTQLPAGFTERRRTETPQANQTLLQLVAVGGDNKQQDFATTVGVLPSDGLLGVGDYNVRHTQTDLYQPFTPPDLPPNSVAFRTIQGAPAFVVFVVHDNRYFEFSFSSDGGATLDQLQTLYLQVIASLRYA